MKEQMEAKNTFRSLPGLFSFSEVGGEVWPATCPSSFVRYNNILQGCITHKYIGRYSDPVHRKRRCCDGGGKCPD